MNINWFELIAGLIGGVGLFLVGMKMMSGSLQKVAGDNLKRIIEKLTSNRFVGFFVGCLVTAIIQSSTATTVMVVGFVNAGLMNLMQALAVVLGANVGTTLTAQIMAFKVTQLALPAIGIGGLLLVFTKKPKHQYTGEIILGFGMLFYGLFIMNQTFAPLQHNPEVKQLFLGLAGSPVLAVLIGALVTMILQSSTATIGITMALATNGLLDYSSAVALVLGENIGTTLTANIAAMGGSRAAKQAAFGHFVLNAIGVTYMVIFLKPFLGLINFLTPGDVALVTDGVYVNVSRHIANAHTIYNIINATLFLFLLGFLAKVAQFFIKSDAKQGYKYTHLADALLKVPETAAAQVRREVTRMSSITIEMLKEAREAIHKQDPQYMSKIGKYEKTLDGFRDEILGFLDMLVRYEISASSLQKVEAMRMAVQHMEEIGDLAKAVLKRTEKMIEKDKRFSDEAYQEIDTLFEMVSDFASTTFEAFAVDRRQSQSEWAVEEEIDVLHKQLRKNHMKRLARGVCEVDAGMYFLDIIGWLENIADHVFSVSQLNVYRRRFAGKKSDDMAAKK